VARKAASADKLTAVWWQRILCWPAFCLLVVAIGVYSTQPFRRFDLALYDAALPTTASAADIVIVAIDHKSLERLGHWPWPRETHAELLDSLRAAGARAVALDLPLTGRDAVSLDNDLSLAAALRRSPHTILPVQFESGSRGTKQKVVPPLPEFVAAAAGVGHVNLERDPDGLARGVCLTEGPASEPLPHLAAALLATLGDSRPLPGEQRAAGSAGTDWIRDHCILIPFSQFAHVSYLDVLQGRVGAEALRNKIALVGLTAEGIGDFFATPRSGHTQGTAGVEVIADVLQALRTRSQISAASPLASVALAVVPLLLAALLLPTLAPRSALLTVVVLVAAAVLCSGVLLQMLHWWWSPIGCLAALLVAYPMYSWQRLSSAHRQLNSELERFADEPLSRLQPLQSESQDLSRTSDFLLRRLSVLREATESLRTVHSLIASTVSSLPDSTVLLDKEGRILLANPAAVSLFQADGTVVTAGASFGAVLERHVGLAAADFATLTDRAPCTEEILLRDPERHLLMRVVPFVDESQRRVGTLIAFSDITELRAIQRERDDVLRFLSHDMKSPIGSLVGLAELQTDQARALSAQELSERIRPLAQRLLHLLDSFISLSRAESADPRRFNSFDFRDAVQDAYDEVWAAAQIRRITIQCAVTDEPCLVEGDRHLLARAVINLLSNSIKFSPEGSTVDVHCLCQGSDIAVTVTDSGPGIPPERRSQLFQRFSRGFHHGSFDPGGAGLGLALVKVVADKHRGSISVEQNATGASFRLVLPLAATAAI
jgi:CHASE2 domain-containing sensor protein/signal transduction histidine kinase